MASYTILYRFEFGDGRTKAFEIRLDERTGRRDWSQADPNGQPEAAPIWVALGHEQCSHCPLRAESNPLCPAARALAGVIEEFKTESSFSEVHVQVTTPERTIQKTLPLQEGLFGLFGLSMATSGCPKLSFLRPMARYHLPFSTIDETIVRSVSFYLLRQYIQAKRGGEADWSLKGLLSAYDDLNLVNQGILARVRSVARGDAEANSVIILDALAQMLSGQLQTGLPDLEPLFDDRA